MEISKRTTVLLGVLLLAVLVLVGQTVWSLVAAHVDPSLGGDRRVEPPLAGSNAITAVTARREPNGTWRLSVSYFYTGAPIGALVSAWIPTSERAAGPAHHGRSSIASHVAKRGANTFEAEIVRPMGEIEPLATSQITVAMDAFGQVLAQQGIEQRIEWPNLHTWIKDRRLATTPPQDILKEAVDLVDRGSEGALDEARDLLERLSRKDPRNDQVYIELARVAMKSNWGPEGLRQAETLLGSAMQVNPDSVNAKILVGYVYTHQGRFVQAQEMFQLASRTESKNLWLWANWGELLVKQGKAGAAIAKYREAIDRPRPGDTYDRARLEAYWRLIGLLEKEKSEDLAAIEALYKQRSDEFGANTCFGSEYAKFLLRSRGDVEGAIERAQRAVAGQCSGPDGRETLGLAYYLAWSNESGARRDELLRQARVYLPPGPRMICQLAASERTIGTVKTLKGAGEAIDQVDNRRFTALALALEGGDLGTARRLLKLGASTTAPIGPLELPVALMPVVSEDYEAIKLMQQFGVDYGKLRYQGTTAIEHARRVGNRRLLEALDRQATSS